MKINFKVRFKNAAFLITFLTTLAAFIYTILGMFNVVPSVSQDTVKDVITLVVELLAMLGIVVDPTTKGINDSTLALTYTEPK